MITWMYNTVNQLNPARIGQDLMDYMYPKCTPGDLLCSATGGESKLNPEIVDQGYEIAKYLGSSRETGIMLATAIAVGYCGYQLYQIENKSERIKALLSRLSWFGLTDKNVKTMVSAFEDAERDAKAQLDKLRPLPKNATEEQKRLRAEEVRRIAMERLNRPDRTGKENQQKKDSTGNGKPESRDDARKRLIGF